MKKNRSMPGATVIPVLGYPDVVAAADWLCNVFGFKVRLRIGSHRAQLVHDGGSVVVSQIRSSTADGEKSEPSGTHSIMVRVTGIDTHFERAQRLGGKVLAMPATFPYGERQYSIEDPGGHIWTFSESVADVDPKEWGGELLTEEVKDEP
jgi:uncharacterized glyoxalase superfamily protein PhnB